MTKSGYLRAAALAALALILLGGCTFRGTDGSSYLSLDWNITPQYVDFPSLPSVVVKGVHYQHAEGTWSAEYVAWDGSWYSFWYTIEVNEGQYSDYDAFGVDGADRYYTMYLYNTGPELYFYDDPVARTLGPSGPAVEMDNGTAAVDRSRYDLGAPETYRFEREGPGYRLSIVGEKRSPLPPR